MSTVLLLSGQRSNGEVSSCDFADTALSAFLGHTTEVLRYELPRNPRDTFRHCSDGRLRNVLLLVVLWQHRGRAAWHHLATRCLSAHLHRGLLRAVPANSEGVGVDLFTWNKRLFRLVVFSVFFVVRSAPFVLAQDIFSDVSNLVWAIIAACYAVVIPMILLGLMIGWIEIAGPWNLQTVKKTGRAQLETGFITLFVFLITPALLGLIA